MHCTGWRTSAIPCAMCPLQSAPAPSQQVNGLNPRQRASAQRTAEWDTVGVSSDEDTPTHQQATSTTAAHTQANGHATQGTSALDGLHSEAPGRLSPTEVKALVSAGQKVNAVCKAVRVAVQARIRDQGRAVSGSAGDARQVIGADGVARALPTSAAAAAATELLSVVVLSHARCDPPELGAALLAIRDAKEADLVSAVYETHDADGSIHLYSLDVRWTATLVSHAACPPASLCLSVCHCVSHRLGPRVCQAVLVRGQRSVH